MNLTPEPEPHVMANCILNAELMAEYWNQGKKFRRGRPSSSTARKRFKGSVDWDGKTAADNRREYFDELAEAIQEIESRVPSPVNREETYEDVIVSFGGTFCGQSEVLPRSSKANPLYSYSGMHR